MRVRGISLIATLTAVAGCVGSASVAPHRATVVRGPGDAAVVESVMPLVERRALDRSLERYLRARPGRAALSVHDRTTGARYSFREHTPFMLASVAKVDILLALLLRRQHARQRLSATERSLAERMIRHSDNDSAHDLYTRIGGSAGLSEVLRELGARHTEPGPGLSWGATRSRPSDQVKVLEELLGPGGSLSARNRRYALELMSSVRESQVWGVSAAGGEVALKNGWLPARVHGGLWTVNSVGRVSVHGHELLIAVLSERSPDMATGIATVERLTRLAVGALTRSRTTVMAAASR
ncbi:serine hydrolase [Nonomuraea sp. NPDC002799]